jgi:diguanylate cyclase (GGDEF)-like protein
VKIGNSKRVSGATRVAATSVAGVAKADKTETARAVSDTSSVLGIPDAEFTPRVREAIVRLMAEVDSLREDVRRSAARIAHLERLADEDPLVPVINRRAFVRELSRMMSFAERYGMSGSLIFLDTNGMKEINDSFGHAAGDGALVHIVRVLLANLRKSDIVGRLGGDEFGVILAQADEGTAADKAAALVKNIGDTPYQWKERAIPLSVSYGIHTFSHEGDPGEVLEAADRAMYERKRSGTQKA